MTSNSDGFSKGRRRFLESSSLLALAPALAAGWASEARGALRTYTPGVYGLELDGVFAGYVAAFSGGYVTSDVVTEKPGPDMISRKHLAGVRVEPITIETSLPMPKPFYE